MPGGYRNYYDTEDFSEQALLPEHKAVPEQVQEIVIMAKDKAALEKGLKEYRQKKRRDNIKYAVIAAVSICVFLIIWQIIVTFKLTNVRNLPAPTEVFTAFLFKLNNKNPDGNTLGTNIIASLQVSLSGFAAAVIIGLPLGLLMGWFEPIDKFVRPIFELVRPIPPIAWIPVVVVFMGIGLKAKATIIFLAVFVSCVINAYTGIKLTDKTLINVAKTCGAGSWETFFKIGIPSAAPMIFAGVRLSLGSAWSTLVAAEMLAAKAGLGYMLQSGRNVSRADIVVLAMVTIAALGAMLSGILTLIENRVLKWRKG